MAGLRRPRIPSELASRIDGVRGDVPFERWVRRALEQALITAEGGPSVSGAEARGLVVPDTPCSESTPVRVSELPVASDEDVAGAVEDLRSSIEEATGAQIRVARNLPQGYVKPFKPNPRKK